jgi:hypothetical protein
MLLLPAAPATTTAISTAIALTPAAASTSATGTFRLGPCFVYIQRASLQLLLIHAIDGGLCLGIRWHFDESEAARLATELRNGPRKLDSAVSGTFLGFQATNSR